MNRCTISEAFDNFCGFKQFLEEIAQVRYYRFLCMYRVIESYSKGIAPNRRCKNGNLTLAPMSLCNFVLRYAGVILRKIGLNDTHFSICFGKFDELHKRFQLFPLHIFMNKEYRTAVRSNRLTSLCGRHLFSEDFCTTNSI